MNKKYRLVVFDWEGTLGDTLGHVLHTLATEATRMHLGELDIKQARRYVALGLVKLIKKMFPDLTLYQQEAFLQSVQRVLYTTSTEEHVFPGSKYIVELLINSGLDVAIATNRGTQSLQRALEESGMVSFFKVIRTASQAPAKPCPQMIQEIMDEFCVSPAETLMIGDSLTDIEMAKLAGVDAIGVDFYHQHRTELLAAGALAVFDDYMELANYLAL